jgi:hypothetical protein
MSDPNQPSTPPGWYPDGQGGQRWWDGSKWTEHTQPPAGGGAPATPPAPAAPAGPPSPGVPGGDLPTQVAPNRAANYPGQQGQPGQPSSPQPQQPPQGVYGAPGGQPGQPGQSSYGQQPPFGGFPPAGGSGGSGGGKGKLFAIIGGAVGAVILIVVLLFVLFNVVLGGGPEDVASDYLDASASGDFEEACELSSKDYQKSAFEDAKDCDEVEDAIQESFENSGLPGYDDYEDFLDDIDYDYEIGDVSEKEKTATVKYTYTVKYTGDEEDLKDFFNEEDVDAEIKLVKEDGDWKVDEDSGNF